MENRVEYLRKQLKVREYTAAVSDLDAGYDWSVYRENPVIRQGHFTKHCLEHMETPIYPGELIVGGLPYREVDSNRQLMPDFFTPEERRDREEQAQKEFLLETGLSEIPDYKAYEELFYASVNYGHIIIGYEKALHKGLRQMTEEVLEHKDRLNTSKEQQDFLQSVLFCLEGAGNYIRRYGEEAARQRKLLTPFEEERKKELEQIEETCRYIAKEPPKTFRQALQMVWFLQLFVEIESGLSAFSYGRMDQYLYPYLKNDLENGILTEKEAEELTDCFWLKNGEYPSRINDPGRGVTIGGRRSDGGDGANLLSYMLLHSLERCRILQPKLNVRIDSGTDPAFFRECCRVSRKNLGPMFYNDEAVLESLKKYGYEEKDAVDYGLIGCYEYGLAGIERPSPMGAVLNVGKCLELALNNGNSMTTGKPLGIPGKALYQYESCEELEEAFKKQVEHTAAEIARKVQLEELRNKLLHPQPMLSAFVEDCIGTGTDISGFGARYSAMGVRMPGIAAAADSLTALKTLCFDSGKLSLERVWEGLQTNFEQDPVLQAELINGAPKYGNDDDRADETAVRVCRYLCEAVSSQMHPSGSRLRPGLFSFLEFLFCGQSCAALPNGRKAGEPFVNGISPTHGMDRNGPTAFFQSAAKLDYSVSNNASTLDFKVPVQFSAGEEGDWLLQNMIADYFAKGGMQVQLYFLSADDLRRAKEHPEEYPELIVRVTGYSAYFVQLPCDLQEEVIRRTAAF